MHLLPQLGHPHSEILLLQSWMVIAKLFFGLRTCQTNHMEKPNILFDKELWMTVEDIVVGGCLFFGVLQWMVAYLPIRVGELGYYSAVEVASSMFVAFRGQS